MGKKRKKNRAPKVSQKSSPKTSKWALAKGLREFRRRFREGNRNLRAGAWKRWALSLLMGLALAALFTAGVTWLAEWLLDYGLKEWDARMLREWGKNGPLPLSYGIKFESPGNITYLLPLSLICMIYAVWRNRPVIGITIPLAYQLMRPLTWVGRWVWNRPRPELILNGMAGPENAAFPSGHASFSSLMFGFLAYYWMRASESRIEKMLILLLYFAWIGLIGLSRLRLGTHWPSDLFGGYLVGIFWLGASVIAIRYGETAGKGSR